MATPLIPEKHDVQTTLPPNVKYVVVVSPHPTRAGTFSAQLSEHPEMLFSSRQPLLDAARLLLSLGGSPTAILVMRWSHSNSHALQAAVGIAAKFTVDEHNGTALARWKPFSQSAGRVPMREKMLALSGTPTRGNEILTPAAE